MDRRSFLSAAAGFVAAAALPLKLGAQPTPEIAFTFDDPMTQTRAGMSWRQINRGMLDALAKHRVKAALFVCGKRVDSPEGSRLLDEWEAAGHLLGSHSYSHLYLDSSKVTLDEYRHDIERNEPLLLPRANFRRIFRFPFFKEGNTLEKRDGVRQFLAAKGYSIGRATIDASDWAIDGRLGKRFDSDPAASLAPYRAFYLEHLWGRAQYYDALAQEVLGHSVRHTILLHHSALNAHFLEDLLTMFEARGWRPIDAAHAYADPIYARQPNILPAGEGLIWALAKESGRHRGTLRYPGEDDVYENPRMDQLGL
jgi:peptidoglycan/xylan/chitin deacetylase (PgdA/CDA1 family)